MILLGATHLLLVGLLLQRTQENEVRTTHDDAAAYVDDTQYHYGEFCLCTSDEALCLQAESCGNNMMQEIIVASVTEETPVPVGEGCRCSRENIKWPASNTIRSITKWSPNEICSSNEYIATLKNESVVCVSAITFLPYVESFLSWLKPDPALGFPASTQPPDASTEEGPQTTTKSPRQRSPPGPCPSCGLSMTRLDAFDPKDVKHLRVIRPWYPCPAFMSVILWDDKDAVYCFESQHFEAVLQKLRTALFPVVDPSDTSKTIDAGCQCQSTKSQPTESKVLIWPPNDNCRSIEVIEITTGGKEQCVSVDDLSVYLREFDRPLDIRPEPTPGFKEVCRVCSPDETWETIEQNAVQSLDFLPPTSHCPAIIFVDMRSKPVFCVDALHPLFRDLLKKLKEY